MTNQNKTPGCCADCGKIIYDGFIKGNSTSYGEYYSGPPICGACINSRYETHVQERERQSRGAEQ